MDSKNRKAIIIALFAGILLLISGVSGLATWEAIKHFVTENIIDTYIVQLLFAVLIFIASLGGISVIIGGFLIGRNKIRTGKLFISLGAGLGLIGLIFSIMVAIIENNFPIGSFFSVGAIGLILSIVARLMVKKEWIINSFKTIIVKWKLLNIWWVNLLGYFSLRDKQETAGRIFRLLVKECCGDSEGLSSDDIADRLELSRGSIVHHLNSYISSGLVLKEHNLYRLRSASLQKCIDEIKADIDRIFKQMTKIATEIDEKLGHFYRWYFKNLSTVL